MQRKLYNRNMHVKCNQQIQYGKIDHCKNIKILKKSAHGLINPTIQNNTNQFKLPSKRASHI